jgi:1-acyl-sn-glycerol-3-phosphate acyltransferase
MVTAALLALATLNAGMSIPQLFLLLAGLNAIVAIYIYTLLPEFLIRFVVWIIINLLYRIRPSGLNVMYYKIFQIPLIKFLFRTARAIPIASAREDADLLDAAFDQIDAELEAGNLVCLFPEGGITHDGEMQTFRPGVEKIIARRAVPVIPIGLGGLWGSWFSRQKGGGLRKIPGRLFARVDVRIGQAVSPGDASAANLELLVRTLRGQNR